MGTEPDLEEVRAALRRHLPGPAWHAYLFGSRARGTAHPMSDWDIGIIGPEPVRGAILEELREELEELRTLHCFDVVDLTSTPAGFQSAALASAVRLV